MTKASGISHGPLRASEVSKADMDKLAWRWFVLVTPIPETL